MYHCIKKKDGVRAKPRHIPWNKGKGIKPKKRKLKIRRTLEGARPDWQTNKTLNQTTNLTQIAQGLSPSPTPEMMLGLEISEQDTEVRLRSLKHASVAMFPKHPTSPKWSGSLAPFFVLRLMLASSTPPAHHWAKESSNWFGAQVARPNWLRTLNQKTREKTVLHILLFLVAQYTTFRVVKTSLTKAICCPASIANG